MNQSEYVEYLDTQITKTLREIEVNLINIYRVSIELQTCVKKPLPYLKELHDMVSPWCEYLRQLVSTPKASTNLQTIHETLHRENALSQEEKHTLQEISNLLAHTTQQLSLHEKTNTHMEQSNTKHSAVDSLHSPVHSEQQAEESLFQVDSPTSMWKDLLEKYSSSPSNNEAYYYTDENIQQQ